MSTQKKIANAAAERLESFQAKQTLETAKASRRKSDNRLAVMFGVGAVALALVGQFAYFSFGPGVVTESTEAPTAENSEVVPDLALA